MFPGFGTVLNIVTVVAGSAVGLLVGHRLPQRTRDVVTDALGLVTLLIAAISAAAVLDDGFAREVGDSATVLVVLGALLIGGIAGSLLRIEARLEDLGGGLQRRLSRDGDGEARRRFVEGFVSTSLLFCVGPLTILGSLSDGMGLGYDQLALKSTMDGFAAVAFAASFGWGVMASALAVGVVQGLLTLVGVVAGSLLGDAYVSAITATGGLLLVGVALRLLRMKPLPVGDLLPALIVAPLLVSIVAAIQS
ncbi:DUF554 domain-containing protein [Jiangella mangrovi]|uniref:Putative membrane protein YqgA involved in biofilm formation n=1 Tax=Jiangella mangrovi TaxID=1524084 RepID=A0A7W9GT97_9ACTN|nr:DUF554 domain-containing protein [Jiangella mangrovi]MBB5789647.1 putative membrane protein YqgA involved in biofilm formation [Jiangella mangrovi]